MEVSKTVHISKLYPSDIEDLDKTFRFVTLVYRPYSQSKDILCNQIKYLVTTIENKMNIEDPERTFGPYGGTKLDDLIDTVNKTTTFITNNPSDRVPEDIRFMQLAQFDDPEVDGKTYSYGLMSHHGNYSKPKSLDEFAILLPYEKQEEVPALILSNKDKKNPIEEIGLIIKAIEYSRRK